VTSSASPLSAPPAAAPVDDGGAAGGAALLPVLVTAAWPAVRAGLIALLADDPGLRPSPLVGAAGAEMGGSPRPAAIVADLSGRGDRAADDLAAAWPGIPLVLLGADPATDGPGLGRGAVAYLSQEVDGPTLSAAVRAVAAGLAVIDPEVAGAARLHAHPAADNVGGDVLSPRELEVLRLVADGLPNKGIARELGISEHTVKFHVGSVLGKLNAGSRAEAVSVAMRRGMLAV
jgi:DNA-binding NarL/FixJ family response regulator